MRDVEVLTKNFGPLGKARATKDLVRDNLSYLLVTSYKKKVGKVRSVRVN